MRSRNRQAAWMRAYRTDALSQQGNACYYCFEPLTTTEATGDHLIPRARRGRITRDNIVAACQPCNVAKGTMSEGQFFKLIKARRPSCGNMLILSAWMRRRIWKATRRVCRRMSKTYGLQPDAWVKPLPIHAREPV